MASPVGIGLVGAAGAFGRFIVEAIEEMGGARLVAVAGRDRERTERAAQDLGAPRAYVDYRRLVADPAVELVIISTPPGDHAAMGIAAAQAGKAIFMEKPVAVTVDECRELLSAVARAGVAATVDFVMRYNAVFDALESWTRRGVLGELRRVDFQNMAADESLPPDHWFWDRARSGGILVEHGVHFFDIYGRLVDAPPVEARGMLTMRPGTDQEDKVLADVRYANGALGSYYHAFDKPSRLERTTAALGYDRGYIEVEGWIATALTVDAIVDDAQAAALAGTPYMRLETVEEYAPDARVTRGNGQDYRVARRVRGVLRLPRSKQDVYRTSVADALRDLVALMREPAHQPRVTLLDGARAVALARAASDPAKGAHIAETWASLRAPSTQIDRSGR
jgi:predicted dehydrogenase